MSFSGSQAGLLPTGTPSTIEPNSWIEALDLATREPRPSTSASVSTIWLSRRQAPSPRRGNVSNKVESQVTQTTRRTDEKTEKMWIYTLRSIAPHGNYGSNQTDSHTPHSTHWNIVQNIEIFCKRNDEFDKLMVLWICDHFWCWPSLIEYSHVTIMDVVGVFHWQAQRGQAPPTQVMNDNPVWPCLVSLTTYMYLDTKLNGNGNTSHGWPFNLLLVFKIQNMIWVLKSCMCQSVSFIVVYFLYYHRQVCVDIIRRLFVLFKGLFHWEVPGLASHTHTPIHLSLWS